MKIRGLNKKGQEAVSNFGVTGIVLVVFLVVVVLGIWYFNSSFKQITNQLPKNAEVIAKACSAFTRESEVNSYCFQIREADKNVYTTCDYARNLNIIILDSDGSNSSAVRMDTFCEGYSSDLKEIITTFCEGKEFSSKVKVNGQSCSEFKEE